MNNKQQNNQPPRMNGRGPRQLFVEKPKNMKNVLKRLAKYIGASKKIFISLLVSVLIVTIFNLIGPYFQGKALDSITITSERLDIDFHTSNIRHWSYNVIL